MVIAIATIHGDARYLEPILQTALDGQRPPAVRLRVCVNFVGEQGRLAAVAGQAVPVWL